MSRSTKLYLQDIKNSVQKILRFTAGLDYTGFVADEKTYDAVITNLMIIGEAVKSLPVELKNTYPKTDWKKIAGLRNIWVHAYFSIDEEILWDIIQTKLNPLLEDVEQILKNE